MVDKVRYMVGERNFRFAGGYAFGAQLKIGEDEWVGNESNGFPEASLNGNGHKDQGVDRAVRIWSPRPKGSSLVEPISDITH